MMQKISTLRNRFFVFAPLLLACLGWQACTSPASQPLVLIAESQQQWTGISINKQTDALYVCYPYWADSMTMHVGELLGSSTQPWPDARWNSWRLGDSIRPDQFVCVQSVVADDSGRLWVVDPMNPFFKGVLGGGGRVHLFDAERKQHLRTYTIPIGVIGPNSYLNDIRISRTGDYAYLTDSGEGGIVVLNLATGQSKRMLHGHRTTQASRRSFTANGHTFSNVVHSDGIALDQTTQTLYYMPLMSDSLYAILAPALIYSRSDAGLETAMKTIGRTGPADGLWIDSTGQVIVSALEQNAILKISPTGQLRTLVQDSTRLLWPDSFTENKRGELFFTTAQIHLPPAQRGPYRIYKLRKL